MSLPRPPAGTHLPVMADEVVAAARTGSHRVVLDGTLGLGGHARALLSTLPGLELYIGLDRDPGALERAGATLAEFGSRAALHHATFDRAGEILDQLGGITPDFILLDLGVSSYQLDTAERGFSFMKEGPLDMRMDPTSGPTALDLIRSLSVEELAAVLAEQGEVTCPGRVARALVENKSRLHTTTDLARVVTDALPAPAKRGLRIHPATTVFLALRSAVNRELAILRATLPACIDRLPPGGRLAVISFHSLEDRIVKQTFQAETKGCCCPPGLPICACGRTPRLKLSPKHSIVPSETEVQANPRSRSARLRIGVRL